MAKLYLLFGAISGFIAVSLGAFGAHGLKERLPERLFNVWVTGTEYQMYHSLAVILIAVLVLQLSDSKRADSSKWLRWSANSFLAGIVLFSGSLYALALTGISWLGMITPLGGVAFLLGWLALALFAIFK
ncbi:membrane protein [Endozoicomonas montiporae]|uniref:Membrane protein n=2 Tax=Endozoicomonas montiporae TaxID=1027273 RepID=A0A081MZL4_9GAMM|nr:DUF423 domain-containing protein [Endozoicomonas montiporae]AMO54678.1 DUF423 family protein YwdK [Endozoicomonas montiporae CL-33]KEQ11637.1 membrane protein [Endozoicomonas montiporae]